MRLMKNLFLGLVLIVPFLFTGCSKKDTTTPQGAVNYKSPTLANDTLIKIPEQMQAKADSGTDFNLALGVEDIAFINALTSGLSGAFIYDQTTVDGWNSKKNSDGSTTYTWSYLQLSFKLTYYSSSSESWWKYEEDSASYSYPFYYIDDKGTSGEIDWYGKDSFTSSSSYTIYKDIWSKASDGTYTSTFTFYDGTTVTDKYVSTSKPDKSGTLDVYALNSNNQLVLEWKYVWDSSGNGSYTYTPTDGSTGTSGTF